MKIVVAKKIITTLEKQIDRKFSYECNSSSDQDVFGQPIGYIEGRLTENGGNPSYDNRFLVLIKDISDQIMFDSESIHRISVINKKFNSLRDYHRDEFIRNVDFEIKMLKQ
jgi:hypothetical protein